MKLIRLQPIYQTRVWGGRELETLFGRALPPDGQPYGESWEVVDRPEAQSLVVGGDFADWTLHELWQQRRVEIFGTNAPNTERFPLLLKILDARDDLSIQVHPPAAIAPALDGEPKTEMWFVAAADPMAALSVGVQPGMTRELFAEALTKGTVADAVHRLPVSTGDFIFIPSGRLHAIGGGLVIFEIQQNSDTTYRVFDWNRVGLDGVPRQLHVPESLQCIDFSDTQPQVSHGSDGLLVRCEYFMTKQHTLHEDQEMCIAQQGEFRLLAIVSGSGRMDDGPVEAGDHLLIPAAAANSTRTLKATSSMVVLEIGF
jgi:mannose-6-phosphate isomerase